MNGPLESPLMSINESTATESQMRWVSQGFEALVRDVTTRPRCNHHHFDVVIVGSGYGGAMAAVELAGSTLMGSSNAARVCLLERGNQYLAGMFPSRLAVLAGHVRF